MILPNITTLSTGAYVVKTVPIQPGLVAAFPWLSHIAALWDNYQVVNLSFRFVPSVPTNTFGTISMGVDYDVYDAAPADQQSFMMMANAVSSSIWQSFSLALPRAHLNRRGILFNRSSAVDGDLKTYDLCNLYIASRGAATSQVVGDVYCDYTIRFSNPHYPDDNDGSYFDTSLPGTSPANVTDLRPFGTDLTAMTLYGGTIFKLTTDYSKSSFRCFSAGYYLIVATTYGVAIEVDGSTGVQIAADGEYPDQYIKVLNKTAAAVDMNVSVYVGYIQEGGAFTYTLAASTSIGDSSVLIQPLSQAAATLLLEVAF